MKPPRRPASRPYHHGDLRRGLIEAAREILEAEGPAGLSLRAVAREAGVSPAAPYHHFRDKGELLDAVAHEGWTMLGAAMTEAKAMAARSDLLLSIGVAYVAFARENPALYRVMYDTARNNAALPAQQADSASAWRQVRETMVEMGVDTQAKLDLELSTVAAWCGAHGLAELCGFDQFQPLIAAMGSEHAFVRSVLSRMRVFPQPRYR